MPLKAPRCRKSTDYQPNYHLRGITKLITHGKGEQRPIEDFMLTRYACYRAQMGSLRKNVDLGGHLLCFEKARGGTTIPYIEIFATASPATFVKTRNDSHEVRPKVCCALDPKIGS